MGCGWLGYPLAKSMVQEGYHVHGSTTSRRKMEGLREAGIHPYRICLGERSIDGDIKTFLEGRTTLIINVPPRLRSGTGENFVRKMENLLAAVHTSSIKRVLFVSSTSVYGDIGGDVFEETIPEPATVSGRQLLQAEELFLNTATLQTIIVRFGGLIGPDRHPVTRLSGKKGLSNGSDAINLIHLDDCIQLITTLLRDGHWNKIFNAVYPVHPQKHAYYSNEAKKRGLLPPQYDDVSAGISGKKVHSKAFLALGYSFYTTIL